MHPLQTQRKTLSYRCPRGIHSQCTRCTPNMSFVTPDSVFAHLTMAPAASWACQPRGPASNSTRRRAHGPLWLAMHTGRSGRVGGLLPSPSGRQCPDHGGETGIRVLPPSPRPATPGSYESGEGPDAPNSPAQPATAKGVCLARLFALASVPDANHTNANYSNANYYSANRVGGG